MIGGAVSAGPHIHDGPIPGTIFIRAVFFLGLAFAIVRAESRFDRVVTASVAWFAVFGAITIAGQLWQRYTDDGTGNYILIDPVFFAFTLACEALLLLAGAILLAVRPGAP